MNTIIFIKTANIKQIRKKGSTAFKSRRRATSIASDASNQVSQNDNISQDDSHIQATRSDNDNNIINAIINLEEKKITAFSNIHNMIHFEAMIQEYVFL